MKHVLYVFFVHAVCFVELVVNYDFDIVDVKDHFVLFGARAFGENINFYVIAEETGIEQIWLKDGGADEHFAEPVDSGESGDRFFVKIFV